MQLGHHTVCVNRYSTSPQQPHLALDAFIVGINIPIIPNRLRKLLQTKDSHRSSFEDFFKVSLWVINPPILMRSYM